MNKVILIGNVASLDLNTSENGVNYARFTLAVRRDFSKGEVDTDFIYCTAFNPNAIKLINTYVEVGNRLGVSGALQTQNAEQNGVKFQRCNILVNEIELLPNAKKETITNNDGYGDENPLPF